MTEINVKTSDEVVIVADPAGSDDVAVQVVEQSIIVETDHVYGDPAEAEAPDLLLLYSIAKL